MKTILPLTAALFSLLGAGSAFAGSATWNLNPGDRDWNKPANWTPATVPNGPGDIATFDFSDSPLVTLSANTEVSSLVFNPGAAVYLINPKPGNVLTISGTGITNNSSQLQSFETKVDQLGNEGRIFFTNSAAAGSSTAFLNDGGGFLSGETDFFDTATADNGTFTNSGGGIVGGLTQFFDSSIAGNGTFINQPGAPLGGAGHTNFFDTSTAGHAAITNEAAASSGVIPPGTVSFNDMSDAAESLITNNGTEVAFGSGAFATFYDFSSGGNATIIANGGNGLNSFSATTAFMGNSTAGNATLIANGNSSQSVGGLITFQESSSGGTSRIRVFGNGALDISLRDTPGVTIGSLEGDGEVHLGANQLTVGSNNLSSNFRGIIDGSGSLIKRGNGKLILDGASTYTGGTLVNGGTLLVARQAGSATSSGRVQVNKGTLGGTGKIAGPVTVGNGTDSGAFLSPGLNGAIPATLSLQRTLTFLSLAAYKVTLDSATATADTVIANGVTIESGAVAFVKDIGTGTIALGTVFIIIGNTSASPIAGTFANLGDNSSFTLNGNNFLVSYEGGDGNDLTLAVVP